jgi:hypothetical protein
MGTWLGPPLGLLAFVILAFMGASCAHERQNAEKEETVPGESTSKGSTTISFKASRSLILQGHRRIICSWNDVWRGYRPSRKRRNTVSGV